MNRHFAITSERRPRSGDASQTWWRSGHLEAGLRARTQPRGAGWPSLSPARVRLDGASLAERISHSPRSGLRQQGSTSMSDDELRDQVDGSRPAGSWGSALARTRSASACCATWSVPPSGSWSARTAVTPPGQAVRMGPRLRRVGCRLIRGAVVLGRSDRAVGAAWPAHLRRGCR
jgi:hypothetical protein